MIPVGRYFASVGLALSLSCSSLVHAAALQDKQPGGGNDTLILRDGRLFDGVRLKRDADQILVHFAHGLVQVPMEKVHEYILAEGEPIETASETDQKQIEAGKVRYRGRWMNPTTRDKKLKKDLAKKRAEIEERKLARLWRNREIVETKNFIFESTAPTQVTAYYRELCEAYFQAFAKTWRIKRGKAGKLKLKFFVNKENYLQVTGVSSNILGFFRFVEPYELCIYYDRLDPRATEEVLFHELGHYLQKLINIDFAYPHWPGEALSEYYGASSWNPDKKKVSVGLVLASRVQNVLFDISSEDWVSIETLLSGAPDSTFHDYTWGWTLVHFLMTDKRHSKNFTKFYLALAKAKEVDRRTLDFGRSILKGVSGESVTKTFRKYMRIKSDADLDDMQRDWYAYIDEKLKITSARGLENAAFNSLSRGRPIRAKRMLEEAIEMGTENALTFFRYAGMLEKDGKHQAAEANFQLAIDHDGLVPKFYISYAEALLRRGTQEDLDHGENMLALALDIEPDNFYLERNQKRILQNGRRLLKAKKKKAPKSK